MSTNHYDVLGIRVSASQQEIELAYKGRRTQYHPDKYTDSDEATLNWATEKMKEINKAYAALADSTSRAAYDSSLNASVENTDGKGSSANRAAHGNPPKATQASPQEDVGLVDFMKKRLGLLLGYERIFLFPNVPEQKLQGVMSSYGAYLKMPSDIVLVIDDTVFGGGKDGVLITDEQLLIKEIGESPTRYLLSELDNIYAKGNAIYVNGRKVVKLGMTNADQLSRVMSIVNEYRQAKKDALTRVCSVSKQGVFFNLEKAKQRFRQLYQLLRRVPQLEDVGELAVDYFERLDSALKDPQLLAAVNEEADLIFALSDNAVETFHGRESVAQPLLQELDDDSDLVTVLRALLHLKRQEEMESERRSRVEKFFE